MNDKVFIYGNEKNEVPILHLQDFINGIEKVIKTKKENKGYSEVSLYSEFLTLQKIISYLKHKDSFVKYVHKKGKEIDKNVFGQIHLKINKFEDSYKTVMQDYKKVMGI